MQAIAYMRQILAAGLASAIILGGAARAEEDGGLTKMACDAALQEGLNRILDAIGIPSDKAGPAYDVWAAYLQNPDAIRLKAAQDKLAQGVAGLLIPGFGPATAAGKFAIDGVEYTIEQANAMRVSDLLCGGSDFGDTWPVGFFSLEGTQQIANGINCDNFADKITTQRDFDRLKSLFWGHYMRTVLEFSADAADRAGKKKKLEEMWQNLYLAWRVKTGAKLDQKLREAFMREAEALKAKEACKTAAEGGAHFEMVGMEDEIAQTVPEWKKSLSPGSITIQYGPSLAHGECTWTGPPKRIGAEIFTMRLTVSATSDPKSNLAGHIEVRSGLRLAVEGTPVAADVFTQGGETATKTIDVALQPFTFDFLKTGDPLHIVVGGCNAGAVHYTYEFRAE